LSHISRRSDVVFGAVVSGRPPDLEGSERMIGLFVNTLPIRLQVEPETEVLGWLRRLQEQQVEMQEYEYTPLVMVQNWSDLPRGASLFESLLVFENYPTQSFEVPEQESSLWFSNFAVIEYSTFPLTLMVGPATQLSLLFLYDTRRFDLPVIDLMLDRLGTILNTLAGATTGTKLEEIQSVVDEADRQDQLVKEKEVKEFHLQKLKSVKRKVVRAG
jgi:non-ribosomal peptide synthetase component F